MVNSSAAMRIQEVKGSGSPKWHEILRSLPSSVPAHKRLTRAGVPGAPAASGSPDSPRQRFYVELKDGETTTICMREMLKAEALKNASAAPPAGSEPAPESVTTVTTHKDQPLLSTCGSRRFTNVMDKIDGFYRGAASDGEDSQGPEVKGYDTDDSFIDDTELNDYFTSGKDMTQRYRGFYIHRGQFEPVVPDEPTEPVSKKRKRADVTQPARGSTPKKRKLKDSQSPAVATTRKGKNAIKPGVNPAKPQNVKKPSEIVKQTTKDVKQPPKATQAKRKANTAVKEKPKATVAPLKKHKAIGEEKPLAAAAAPKRVYRRVQTEEGGAAQQIGKRKYASDKPPKKEV